MQLGIADDRDRARAVAAILDRNLSPEEPQQPLCMIPRRELLDDGGAARRVQPGKKHCGLYLRRRHGQVVDDGKQVLGAVHLQRQRGVILVALHIEAHRRQWLEHAAHGTAPQRGVARKLDTHVMTRDHAEHQPAAGA